MNHAPVTVLSAETGRTCLCVCFHSHRGVVRAFFVADSSTRELHAKKMPRGAKKGRGKGRGGGRGHGRGGPRAFAASATPSPGCLANATALGPKIAALPSYFLRHWPPRSINFATAQQTYDQQAGWGRTRFQIVKGQLYYPNLKHNTFGCVLRRTPILAWALLEMLERHPNIPDVDISVNWYTARMRTNRVCF